MTLARFKSSNHPQQTGKRGPDAAVDDRGTDQAYFDSVSERFGGFTLDVAAAPHNAKCERFYTVQDDGLAQPWDGNVWCNPPYSNCRAWVEKAWEEWRSPDLYRTFCSRCEGPATFTLNRCEYSGDKPLPLHRPAHTGPGAGALDLGSWHRKQYHPGENDSCLSWVKTSPEVIVMLLAANRTEQGWWQDHVEPFRDRKGSPLRVEFLRGRMRFDRPQAVIGPKGDRPPFGCCLLIWGP